jgi:hypothetical protein
MYKLNIPIATLSFCLLFFSTNNYSEELQIPRSATGDKGSYYLVSKATKGSFVTSIHKRIGPGSIIFTRLQTDCDRHLQRMMGVGYEGLTSIKNEPTEWYDLIPGSSKNDVADFVCKDLK